MGRKKKAKPDDEEQSARFLETAKNVQAEDAKERFEKASAKILRTKSNKHR